MADLTNKQINMANRLIQLATSFDDLCNAMEAVVAEYPHVGEMTDEILSSNKNTKHLETDDMATLMSRFNQVVSWIDEEEKFRRDILLKCRL